MIFMDKKTGELFVAFYSEAMQRVLLYGKTKEDFKVRTFSFLKKNLTPIGYL